MSDTWIFESVESEVQPPPEALKLLDNIIAKWIARAYLKEEYAIQSENKATEKEAANV